MPASPSPPRPFTFGAQRAEFGDEKSEVTYHEGEKKPLSLFELQPRMAPMNHGGDR
ncbi:hypothetical protein BH23VER1_BH23VER1_35710 [soil metagenome]